VPKRIRRRPDADPREGRKKYGDTVFADPTNKKYPIDTPGRIKHAWAYIHTPVFGRRRIDVEFCRSRMELHRRHSDLLREQIVNEGDKVAIGRRDFGFCRRHSGFERKQLAVVREHFVNERNELGTQR
jgi:uncharacterized protein DUF6582